MARKKEQVFKDHEIQVAYEALHHLEPNATDGGRCLSGHRSAYRRSSCSYRWQAVYRAEQDEGKHQLYGQTFNTDPPPFKTGSKPWPNEAHHLIPKAQLVNAIGDIARNANANLQQRILQSLMQSPYNINRYVNMMILPQRARESFALGLPAHPSHRYLQHLEHGKNIIRTHADYSARVRTWLDAILSPYKGWVASGVCSKPAETGAEIVKQLEAFSTAIHDEIVAVRGKMISRHSTSDTAAELSINSGFFCKVVDAAFDSLITKGLI